MRCYVKEFLVSLYSNNGTGHADAKIKKYDVIADDWDTSIITREQYEAALAAKDDGWIEGLIRCLFV